MNEFVIKIDEKDYLGKDNLDRYTLTSDLNKALIFSSTTKAVKIMQSSTPKTIRNKKYSILKKDQLVEKGFIQDKEKTYLPVDFDVTKDLIASLESQLAAIQNNVDYWNDELSEIDKKISDILHYVEFNVFSASDGYKLAKALKEYRLQRREIKNKLEFAQIIDSNSCSRIAQGKTMDSIRRIENKIYTPRVLKDLFDKHSIAVN